MQMSQHTEVIYNDPKSLIDLDVRKPARLGIWLVIAGFGGFLLWSWLAPLETYPEAEWDRLFQLNLKAPFFLTRALLPLLDFGTAKDSNSASLKSEARAETGVKASDMRPR